MREIVGKAQSELGRELKEAQDKLAGSRYDGVFEKWYRSMGFTKTSVYNYIYYFAEVQRLNSKSAIETFEELPKGLAYEIAKPSAESTIAKSQAKAEVLDGKIDTLKAYRQRIQELETQAQLSEEKRKQAESLAESARKNAEIKERQLERTRAELAEISFIKLFVILGHILQSKKDQRSPLVFFKFQYVAYSNV
ncbi:hypothetical protein [Rummeliibacillus sp. SL167]|uniref:hypothetical protein n=1 Tax=Rummeliibacillus sp. SL167 TaxID=2579792 RepID=UPI0011B6D79E|nr:hypothetical protein [Rummeliibacillus sp. SL167]